MRGTSNRPWNYSFGEGLRSFYSSYRWTSCTRLHRGFRRPSSDSHGRSNIASGLNVMQISGLDQISIRRETSLDISAITAIISTIASPDYPLSRRSLHPSFTMRFSSIVATFALAASASAWKIPQGTEDGVYKVETLADGSTVHTKIIDAADIDRSQPLVPGVSHAPDGVAPLQKRSAGQVWCGCGYNMVSGDCDAAVADLKTQLVSTSETLKPGNILTPLIASFYHQPWRGLLLHSRQGRCLRLQPW